MQNRPRSAGDVRNWTVVLLGSKAVSHTVPLFPVAQYGMTPSLHDAGGEVARDQIEDDSRSKARFKKGRIGKGPDTCAFVQLRSG